MCKAIEVIRNDAKEEGRAEGRAEGIAEGRAEGMLNALVGLVQKGLLNLAQAAEEAGMSISEFESKTKLRV